MTAPTIPFPEGVFIETGSSRDETARVLKAQFGNNYTQRSGDGLNPIDTEMSIVISSITRVDSKTITDFLRERAGYQSFLFTIPGEDTPRQWTCEKWTVSHSTAVHDTISATLTEVFTP
ncbi:minor tail protein M [Rhizobium phage RHph_I4]|nr:minor tail protein M [Rhizobium phage RHph_I4]